MKRNAFFPALLLVGFFSCNPYKALRHDSFTYTVDGSAQTMQLKVPKGGRKRVETDSAGNRAQVYSYGNGARLYFVKLAPGGSYPSADTTDHIGKAQLHGGLFYKELGADGRYWREVFAHGFRMGYRGATPDQQEARFDSSLNYVRVR
ncbi:MAG: hypothetical protein JWP27_2576 [Flaviaesturariibacter sp.]|nr:hypothetical protein [Flaviaesturariibacter sp.]